MNKIAMSVAGIAAMVLIGNSPLNAAVTFDWAVIGNPGNTADLETGHGAVADVFSMATTEVTTAQYVEFLNAVAADDIHGLYSSDMTTSVRYKGILRVSGDNGWEYSINEGEDGPWADRPVLFVNWYDTLRFVNWLQNGQQQNASTTEYGVYDMSLQDTDPETIVRNGDADYWLPNEDEWYKAAYYDPSTGQYYDYATGTDTLPDRTAPDDDEGNSANYYDGTYIDTYRTTEVGAYTLSASPYGTYDQTGNVWEWLETLDDSRRVYRGGSWSNYSSEMMAGSSRTNDPDNDRNNLGFRVASSYTGVEGDAVPEPASVGLVLLSIGGLVMRRVRKS